MAKKKAKDDKERFAWNDKDVVITRDSSKNDTEKDEAKSGHESKS